MVNFVSNLSFCLLAAEAIWFDSKFRYEYYFCVYDFESFLETCDIKQGNTHYFFVYNQS